MKEVGTFVILPISYAIFLAFHKIRILGELRYRFIGLKSIVRMADDERVWIALKNTAEYVALVVPIQTILALVLALVLNSAINILSNPEMFTIHLGLNTFSYQPTLV